MRSLGNIKSKIIYPEGYTLLDGEKLAASIKIAKSISLKPVKESEWNRKLNVNINEENAAETITRAVENILRIAVAKQKSREYGFICLFTDGNGTYWNKISRGFSTALNESLATLETLADQEGDFFNDKQKAVINEKYRILDELSK